MWHLSMAAIILAGCAGGGGGDGNGGGDRVSVADRIAFAQSLSRSVFAEGKLAFHITPGLAADESVSCNVVGEQRRILRDRSAERAG